MYLAAILFACYVVLPALWVHVVCKWSKNDCEIRYGRMGMIVIAVLLLIVFCFEGQLK